MAAAPTGLRLKARQGAGGVMAIAGIAAVVLSASAVPSPISFAWDANPVGDNVTNYNLYFGTVSGTYTTVIDVGNVTSYQLQSPGGPRYYALTAENANGESVFSDELVR